MKTLEFRLELDDYYYFNPRKDAPYQLTRWLVYFLRDKIYMEIFAVRKGRNNSSFITVYIIFVNIF